MGILFCFCNPELGQTVLTDFFTQNMGQVPWGKGHLHGKGFIILGHGHKGCHGRNLLSMKSREIIFGECPGDLPGTIGPEIEENQAVSIPEGARRYLRFAGDVNGLDKLICLPRLVGRFHGLNGI